MNGYLLDTHVWLWIAGSIEHRFSPEDEAAILSWQEASQLFLSPMSVWEVAQKLSTGKIDLLIDLDDLVQRSFAPGRFRLWDMSLGILIAANRLPGEIHADPVDRILAATAREHDLTLVTHDSGLRRYGKQGHLKVHKLTQEMRNKHPL